MTGGDPREGLVDVLDRLHVHKDADYGDAWRRRGEVLGIFANLARKHDRLQRAFSGGGPGHAEPLADNVADLLVYGCKYLTWIAEGRPDAFDRAGLPVDADAADARNGVAAVSALLRSAARVPPAALGEGALSAARAWELTQRQFAALEQDLLTQPPAEVYPAAADYTRRAQVTWLLVARSFELLAILKAQRPADVADLEALVAGMDGVVP